MPPKWKEVPIHPSGFAPDLPPNTPGAIQASSNLYPTMAGFATLPIGVAQVAAEGSAAQVIGTFSGLGTNGVWQVYKATAAHIFRAASPYNGTWTEYDNSQTFTAPAGSLESFAMRATDVYASNGTDALQKSAAGAQFQALTASVGSVPIGKINLIVQPGGLSWFLMVFNLSTNASGWASSGVGDDHDWGYNVATLGATGFLEQSDGPIVAAATIRTGIIALKNTSFYFGTFVGPPNVWSFPIVSKQIGTLAPKSLVNLGDAAAWLGPDDFYLFDGYSPQRIPNDLKNWFFKNVNPLQLNQVIGRYDAVRNCVFWHFPLGASSSITSWIAWSRQSNRWTNGTLSLWDVFAGKVPRSANALDTVPAYINTAGAMLNYPPPPAGTDTVGSLLTWDIGIDDDQFLAVTRAKLHWKTRPTGSQSLNSVVKQFPGTAGVAGTTVAAPNVGDYFDLVQTANWQNLTFNFAGDAEVDAVGIESEWAGVQ